MHSMFKNTKEAVNFLIFVFINVIWNSHVRFLEQSE